MSYMDAFTESKKYFSTPLQEFVFYDKYSRFNYGLGRRETWIETVDRAVDYLKELSENRLDESVYSRIRDSIINMRTMPSMRLIAMAGDAARRDSTCIYNCSYMPVDSIESFVEALVISMNGCGVGFSVESQYVSQLPKVEYQSGDKLTTFVVADSTEGWLKSVRVGLNAWFSGKDIDFDFSLVRPAGTVLRTKGGRASGPEPLKKMLEFARGRILSRQGGKISTLDAHDIMCEIGNASIQGGTRRTAMISLFDHNDNEMLSCKEGNFWVDNPQRWNSNNSTVWPDEGIRPQDFINQFLEMFVSGNGEPGIFNRAAVERMKPKDRVSAEWGVNPCAEITLRPFGLCNLSAAIARSDDTFESLKDKVEVASIIGTIQSMATHFPNLRSVWQRNCEEERLLGVDITGQMDCPLTQSKEIMSALKEIAIETNEVYARELGIPKSASVTCVKPSGNTSQLVNCSSGLHPRWSPFYVRNVRVFTHSPVYKVLRDSNVPMSPENGQSEDSASTWVARFPVKSPNGAITRHNVSAIDQCEHWLLNKIHWTTHNPSVTITYGPDELVGLMNWVWEHRDIIGGMSFLPSSDATYDQMPYQEIGQDEYENLISTFPTIDFSDITLYEIEDYTTASSEMSCFAGQCEVDYAK